MRYLKFFIAFAFIKISSAAEAGYPFQFDSDESFGKWVVAQAIDYYRQINDPQKFSPIKAGVSSVHSDMWEEFSSSNGRALRIQNGEPAEAVRDLLDKGGSIDDAMAMDLVMQLIRLDLLGDTLFNDNPPLAIPSRVLDDDFFEFTRGKAPSMLGEFGSLGSHVVCVGMNRDDVPLYLGFSSFFDEPKTQREIECDSQFRDTDFVGIPKYCIKIKQPDVDD